MSAAAVIDIASRRAPTPAPAISADLIQQLAAAVAQILAAGGTGQEKPPAPTLDDGPTVGEMWSLYSAVREQEQPGWLLTYAKRMRCPLVWFDIWPVARLTSAAWAEYRAVREVTVLRRNTVRVSRSTIRVECDTLKSCLSWALEEGLIPANPATKIKRDRAAKSVSQSPFREEHLERLLTACKATSWSPFVAEYMRAYVLVGLDGGARQHEIGAIRWSQIDAANREISLTKTKGSKPRVIMVTKRTIDALLALPRVGDSPFVFTSARTGLPFTTRTLSRWVVAAVKASGIEAEYETKVRSHGLRHGHATAAIRRGIDIKSVQSQLGHSSLAVTDRYIGGSREQRRRAARMFEAAIAAETGAVPK